jgi:transcriptional regulator with XRE-family HTH domain
MKRLFLSKTFLTALKLNDLPAYRIAQMAGVDPSTLSKLINGISLIRENDERITKVAAVLGLSAHEAFVTNIKDNSNGNPESSTT